MDSPLVPSSRNWPNIPSHDWIYKTRFLAIRMHEDEIGLLISSDPNFYTEPGGHVSLHMVHQILEFSLRTTDDLLIYERVYALIALSVPGLDPRTPLRRISSLGPLKGFDTATMTVFKFRLHTMYIYLGTFNGAGFSIFDKEGDQEYCARFEDEVQAILRLCELRHQRPRLVAYGYPARGGCVGEIYYLETEFGEVIGSHPVFGDGGPEGMA